MTLEDPVEYRLSGIRQSSVQSGKLDFAAGVRGILRQDPDIILIGEIRDRETAELALRASMTGHLVFATLHTRSALGAYQRLTDLGVERGVLLESVIGVISQRLLRTFCSFCTAHESDISSIHQSSAPCSRCRGSGYSGRSAIAEVLHPGAVLNGIFDREGWLETGRLRRELSKTGFRSLSEAARQLVDCGKTSMTEVRRVLGEECTLNWKETVG